MTKAIFHFATTKTQTGFAWSVSEMTTSPTPFENGLYAKSRVIKSGQTQTRAQATGAAKRWTLFLRKGGKIA